MKKNRNFKINNYLWPVVVLVLLVIAAIWTNVGIMQQVDQTARPQAILPAPALPQMNMGQVQQQAVQMPAQQQEQAGSPTTILAVQEDISRVIAMARPSVVGIFRPQGQPRQPNPSGLTYLDPFRSNDDSAGSGVIIDPRGYVLTTFQTIGKSDTVQVTVFSGGRRDYQADVVNVDQKTDLVLLKMRTGDTFPSAVLGNSDLTEIGDIVLAVGSPFGFARTVTMGIVSSSNRHLNINGVRYPDMIQIDASINEGNGGGPLVNVKGEVIGITMACYMPDNHYSGIGFAVPMNDVAAFLNANL